jgi:transketolase C-terminal domain/subunit
LLAVERTKKEEKIVEKWAGLAITENGGTASVHDWIAAMRRFPAAAAGRPVVFHQQQAAQQGRSLGALLAASRLADRPSTY